MSDQQPFNYPPDMVFNLGNCGIVAMAICANVNLKTATDWFRKRQNVNRNWNGSTRVIHYPEFLRVHGTWFVQHDFPRDRQRLIGDFVTWGAKPDTLYAIQSAGHMMVCMDGWIGDQHRICKLDGSYFWKRNARVKQAWEIIR